jgi:hypothetical protein
VDDCKFLLSIAETIHSPDVTHIRYAIGASQKHRVESAVHSSRLVAIEPAHDVAIRRHAAC